MKTMPKGLTAVGLFLIVMLVLVAVAQAGSVNDYGQLSGTPAQANYVAWLSTGGTPPDEVLTEDGYNGNNGGYISNFWIIDVGNFSAAVDGVTVNMLFGGLGASAGTTWNTSFVYDAVTDPNTDHGTVTSTAAGTCPVMTQGSLAGDAKTVNWTGVAGSYYLIYRSTQPSGNSDGHSNGRYQLVTAAPVQIVTANGTYVDTAAGTQSWHIVVPSDASGNITGCHSEEANPNAVGLSSLRAINVASAIPALSLGGVLVLGGAGLGLRRLVRGR